jgi:hypothetical protein
VAVSPFGFDSFIKYLLGKQEPRKSDQKETRNAQHPTFNAQFKISDHHINLEHLTLNVSNNLYHTVPKTRAVDRLTRQEQASWPARGWLGLTLVAVCWPLNWMLPGVRTAYLFFPLWLGYILLVDALVWRRTGSSLWIRSRKDFVLLFVISAPVWWLFELINLRTANWEYLGRDLLSSLEFNLLSTLSFSTVMPAVFETAELMRSFGWLQRFASGPRAPATARVFVVLFLAGVGTLALMLSWPKIFYPFAWTSLVLIFEPLNYWTGRPYFLKELRDGDWRTVISLSLGALVCGLFWEMWNYYSFPKWVYHIPRLGFWHIFEMPLLGYGGYVPFALELYALKNFLWPSGPRLGRDE